MANLSPNKFIGDSKGGRMSYGVLSTEFRQTIESIDNLRSGKNPLALIVEVSPEADTGTAFDKIYYNVPLQNLGIGSDSLRSELREGD